MPTRDQQATWQMLRDILGEDGFRDYVRSRAGRGSRENLERYSHELVSRCERAGIRTTAFRVDGGPWIAAPVYTSFEDPRKIDL